MIPALRRIAGFLPDPVVNRVFRELESNVADWTDVARRVAVPRWTVRRLSGSLSRQDAAFWEFLVADSTASAFPLILPAPVSGDAGKQIAIVKESGNITVIPVSGRVTGSTSETLSTSNVVRVYLCDGVDYWRVG